METSSGIKLVDEDDEKILKLLAKDQELDIDSIYYPQRRRQQQRDHERFFFLLFYNNIFWIDSLWYLKDFFEHRQGVYLLKTVLYHKCGYAQYLDINIQPMIGKVSEDVEIFTRPTFYLKSHQCMKCSIIEICKAMKRDLMLQIVLRVLIDGYLL